MRWAWLLAAGLLLVGCDRRQAAAPIRGDTAGDRLEAAAMARGLVTDPARSEAAGLYARGEDRICVMPRAGEHGAGYRIGILVRFDDAQGCTARGVASRDGDRLRVGLTDGNRDDCHFVARFEGDRIVLPAELPADCDRRCTGRASMAALAVDRLSDGSAEAGAQRDGQDRLLCGD